MDERRPPGRVESRWFDVKGRLWHVYCATPPPKADVATVVLVHGVIVSGRYMVPTLELMAPRFRAFAPDLPGHGRSEKPERGLDLDELADALADWMDAAGLERAMLVGNSMGCQVVARFAARHPRRTDRIVLQAPTIDRRARDLPRQLARLLRDMPRERLSLLLIMLRDLSRVGAVRALQMTRIMLADRIEDVLPLVQAPALVIHGSEDPILPQVWAAEVASLLPEGRLMVVNGAPHAMNYSMPLELLRAAAAFLEGREVPARATVTELESRAGTRARALRRLRTLRA
jgi:pimeloyl-ACP methyl ester carboxylesterase